MKTTIKAFTSAIAASVLLAGTIMPGLSYAVATPNTAKQEVVYMNLDGSGNIKDIDVVNIFSMTAAGEITDYGAYSSVRNMTTTDKINYADNITKITTASAGKIYYDGKLIDTTTPWKVEIHYYLDGQEISASDLAGKSGALKITLKISRNNTYKGPDFFKNYALQGSISLDNNNCSNIVADGATIANVGEDKQLTYIALPNEGADYTITADVTDFATDGFSINALPLSLNVTVDDAELLSQINELQTAVADIDDGTGAVKDGISTLQTGIDKVQTSLNAVNANSKTLANGSNDFLTNLQKVQMALAEAKDLEDNTSKLVAASAQIKTGINDIADNTKALSSSVNYTGYATELKKNGLDITDLQTKNIQTISALQTEIAQLNTQISALKQNPAADPTTLQALQAQVAQLTQIVGLLQANSGSISGTQAYLSSVNGVLTQLNAGVTKLQSEYQTFDNSLNLYATAILKLANLRSGIDQLITAYKGLDTGTAQYTGAVAQIVAGYNQLANGTISLVSGSSTLKDGTAKLRSATTGLDTKVKDKINDLINSIEGNAHIGSFVSSDNTNVEGVQFVIKTEKIEKVETKTVTTETTKNLNFWDKLVNLFKK